MLKFVFNGLKKHLYICVLTAYRPSFPHLETLKKILENSTLSRYVKKKKKKKIRPTDPIFKFWSGEGNITIFFFWPNNDDNTVNNNINVYSCVLLTCVEVLWYYRKASSRGAYGHDPFLSVFEEHRLDSTTTDISTALFIL